MNLFSKKESMAKHGPYLQLPNSNRNWGKSAKTSLTEITLTKTTSTNKIRILFNNSINFVLT